MRAQTNVWIFLGIAGLLTAACALWLMISPKRPHPPTRILRLFRNKRRIVDGEGILVSLTTVPWRLARLEVVLKSLRSQLPHATIQANIPFRIARKPFTEYDTALVGSIEALARKDKNMVVFRTLDVGPITKVLPSLQHPPPGKHFRAVLVVDDNTYPAGWLRSLLKGWKRSSPSATTVQVPFIEHQFVDSLPVAVTGYTGYVLPMDLAQKAATLMDTMRMIGPCRFSDDIVVTQALHDVGAHFTPNGQSRDEVFAHMHAFAIEDNTNEGSLSNMQNHAEMYKRCIKSARPHALAETRKAEWGVMHMPHEKKREKSLRKLEQKAGLSMRRITPLPLDEPFVIQNAQPAFGISLPRASHNQTYLLSLLAFVQQDGPADEWFVLCEDDLIPHPTIDAKTAVNAARATLDTLTASPFELVQFGGAVPDGGCALETRPFNTTTQPFVDSVQQLLPPGFSLDAKVRCGTHCIGFKRSFARRFVHFMTGGTMDATRFNFAEQQRLIARMKPGDEDIVAIDRTFAAFAAQKKTHLMFVMGPHPYADFTNGLFVQGTDIFPSSLN